MTSQYLISNQTKTPLYANDGTRYAPLPPWSMNTAILTSKATGIKIAKDKDAKTGTPLSSTNNYMIIQNIVADDTPYYGCISGTVGEISKDLRPHAVSVSVTGTSASTVGTSCVVAAGGSWNFDVIKDKPVSGFTDALLIVPAKDDEKEEGGGGDGGEEEEEEETADDGWSWTTWALIIGGILLLLFVLGLIIYFATRKPKTPAKKPDSDLQEIAPL